MFLKCGYLSAREILRMIRTNRTTNYPALGKKCRIVDVESRDAVYRSKYLCICLLVIIVAFLFFT